MLTALRFRHKAGMTPKCYNINILKQHLVIPANAGISLNFYQIPAFLLAEMTFSVSPN